jgi:hypothetical protein
VCWSWNSTLFFVLPTIHADVLDELASVMAVIR